MTPQDEPINVGMNLAYLSKFMLPVALFESNGKTSELDSGEDDALISAEQDLNSPNSDSAPLDSRLILELLRKSVDLLWNCE